MRTLLLLSIAAGAVILADQGHAAQHHAAEAAAAAQEAVDAARASAAEPGTTPTSVTIATPAKPGMGYGDDHGVTYQTETRVISGAPVVTSHHSPAVTTVAATYRGDAAPADRGEWICTQDGGDGREYRCRFDGEARADHQHGWQSNGSSWQQGHAQHGYGYGWYTPGVIVTTTTTAPVVTETVTTETFYETVPVRHRHVHKKRHYKPKPKPRCLC